MITDWKNNNTILRGARLLGMSVLSLSLISCSTLYYRTLETVGIEKRDVLVDRVDDARDSQTEAKDQFSSALEQYRSVVAVEGGDLETIYDRLNTEYERSLDRAEEVRERIASIENVADDLFDEWEDEIGTYSDAGLRRQSETLLRETQAEYRQLIAAMHRAEGAMEPVLTMFSDQVLILRHNLNARAIGSLDTELREIEAATETLIAEMERAIEEASRFIVAMA